MGRVNVSEGTVGAYNSREHLSYRETTLHDIDLLF